MNDCLQPPHRPGILPVYPILTLTGTALSVVAATPIVVVLSSLLLPLFLTGCASSHYRVGDVWLEQRTHLVGAADENWFLRDRASRLTTAKQPLPDSQSGQRIVVSWTGANVTMVKFEYRQVTAPEKIQTKTVAPTRRRLVRFDIVGTDHSGGPVSAWRVSLWHDDQEVAYKTSALWLFRQHESRKRCRTF
jgi:hypothetical protein